MTPYDGMIIQCLLNDDYDDAWIGKIIKSSALACWVLETLSVMMIRFVLIEVMV